MQNQKEHEEAEILPCFSLSSCSAPRPDFPILFSYSKQSEFKKEKKKPKVVKSDFLLEPQRAKNP